MALSTFTREEISNQFFASLRYDLGGGVAMARDFIEACRASLHFRISVKRSSHGLSRGGGGEEVELDQSFIAEQLAKAEAWLKANDDTSLAPSPGGGGVVHPDFTDFRC